MYCLIVYNSAHKISLAQFLYFYSHVVPIASAIKVKTGVENTSFCTQLSDCTCLKAAA